MKRIASVRGCCLLGFLSSAFFQASSIDLVQTAANASWVNNDGLALPFPGNAGDKQGFVRLTSAALEDGQSYTNLLQTHPPLGAGGSIEGRFDLNLPEAATLQGQVGFIRGQKGLGVNVEISWKEGDRESVLQRFRKVYNGQLTSLRIDLLPYGGHTGTLVMRVKAAGLGIQDRIVWKELKIASVQPQAALKAPQTQAGKPGATVGPGGKISGGVLTKKIPQLPAGQTGPSAASAVSISQVPPALTQLSNRILQTARREGEPAWAEARLGGTAVPFHRLDLGQVAYYEYEIQPGGSLLLATSDHDDPVSHLSPTGTSISRRLDEMARKDGKQAVKFFKLDDDIYAAEDAQGELVAYLGAPLLRVVGGLPSGMDRLEAAVNQTIAKSGKADGKTFQVKVNNRFSVRLAAWNTWPELKQGYAAQYKAQLDLLKRSSSPKWKTLGARPAAIKDMIPGLGIADEIPASGETLGPSVSAAREAAGGASRPIYYAGPYTGLADAAGVQPMYYQFAIDCGTGYAGHCGWSGCGPTAWAMLYSWIDNVAAAGWPFYRLFTGIYRKDGGRGPDEVAPLWFNGDARQPLGVINMTREIFDDVDPFCVASHSDGCYVRATDPSKMNGAFHYLEGRLNEPAVVLTEWNTVGVPSADLRRTAFRAIVQSKVPVILGTGHLSISHYCLAYATRDGGNEFYVNQGWGGTKEWVSRGIWFVGMVLPSYGDFSANDGFACGDVNGDGMDDVVIAGDASHIVDVFDADYVKLASFNGNFTRSDALACGDVNGDGKDEILIAGDVSGTVDIFDGSGRKLASFDGDYSINDGFAAGDTNGDGKDEILIAGDVSGTVDIFNGSGRKLSSFDGDFTINDGFAARDINGDRRAEILIAGDGGHRVDIFGAGGRKLSSFDANYTLGDGFAVGDVNGDGRAEIVVAGDGSRIIDIFNAAGIKLRSFDGNFTRNDALALGDVNHDGKLEILVAGDGTGIVDIWDWMGRKVGML